MCHDWGNAMSSSGLNQPTKVNGLAFASMVLGIASFPMLFFYGGGLLLAIAAIITGQMARRQIEEDPHDRGGGWMATAGVVTRTISSILGALMIILVILGPDIADAFDRILSGL